MIGAEAAFLHTRLLKSRGLFISVLALLACLAVVEVRAGVVGAADKAKENRLAGKKVEAVLERHADQLISLPGVVGVAVGLCEGEPCIKVMVAKKTPELLKKIPSTLEGYPVTVEETGEFRRLGS